MSTMTARALNWKQPAVKFELNYDLCLDDTSLANSILEKADENGGRISDAGIVFALRNILKMKYYPVAVKYFFHQAERFVKTKKRLPRAPLGFATAPLHNAPFQPDLIHGMCDTLQSYHLANDWDAAFDNHPFEMVMTMNSSICHGCVQCYVTEKFNVTQMCSSSYTAGKTEQGEINWIMPYEQMEPTVHWMLERTVRDGGVSFPRTGETYPGFDVCKLCSFLTFKKPSSPKKLRPGRM